MIPKISDIVLKIRNNSSSKLIASIFGLSNPMDNSNAHTTYSYNISGDSYNTNQITIQARTAGTSFQTYTIPLLTQSAQGVQQALNSLGFGSWFLNISGPTTIIGIKNDQIIFGDLTIATTLLPTAFTLTTIAAFSGTASLNIVTLLAATVTVDWGDGNTNTYTGTNMNPSHTYSAPGLYTISVGHSVNPSQIQVTSNASIQSISTLILETTLQVLNAVGNQFTALPTIPNNVTNIDFSFNQLTSLPVALPTLLSFLRVDFNQLTSLPVIPTLVNNILANNNQLTVAAVSNSLIQLDANGLNNGIVDLSNQTPAAPPNAGGATAAANLIGKGWTVTTD